MKTIKLTFKRNELLYDIKNVAFVEGDVIPGGTENNRHQTIDIAEEGNIDRVTRILDLVFAEIVESLYILTKCDAEDGTIKDDTFTETDVYTTNLNVPDDFSDISAEYLEKLIHELLVARVLGEWLAITYPTASEKWQIKASDIKDKILSTSRRTSQRARLKLHPW